MNIKDMRIVFMGTPEIAKQLLEALIINDYHIIAVIAQPDRPQGRKKTLSPVPTKQVALEHNIPCYQPTKIRLDYQFLYDLKPDLIITLAYGQIVPQEVLDIPLYGCLNFHGSLLPKYRGAAPIQYALINNEKVTGMTLMEMTSKMDAGRMYAKEEIAIEENDNATTLFQKMGKLATELALYYLPLYGEQKLVGEYQNEEEVTFAPSIKKEQEKLDLSLSVHEVLGWIRGLSDEPGGYVIADDRKWKILKAHYYDDHRGEIGTLKVIDKKILLIQASDGRFAVDIIQKEGKPRMDIRSFLNGVTNIEDIKVK